MTPPDPHTRFPSIPPARQFRKAVVRGLAVLFPPLLTVIIFLWVINTTRQYVLEPVSVGARDMLVWAIADVRQDLPLTNRGDRTATADGRTYRQLDDDSFVPLDVYDRVRSSSTGRIASEDGQGCLPPLC